jgi:hypothetical protein
MVISGWQLVNGDLELNVKKMKNVKNNMASFKVLYLLRGLP